MKKRMMLCIVVAAVLTGCGNAGNQSTDDANVGNQSTEEFSENMVQEEVPQTLAQKFTFDSLKNTRFEFSSGAGAWSTGLYIYEDGSFEGLYSDADMGSNGDGYPDGTVYSCEFSGNFDKNIEVIDEYTVKVTLDSMEYANPAGTEEIADNVKYVYSDAYGLAGADSFYIYLPGKPISELDESVLSWISMAEPGDDTLSFYVFYNEDEGDAFYSYDATVAAQVSEMISAAESLDSVYSQNMKEAKTQLEYNTIAESMYQNWDGTLNEVWKLIAADLDDATMEQLRAEERQWIADKDAAVEKEAASAEGGSAYAMIKYTTAAEITKERVYELQKYAAE